jgi:hypothetical protein
VPPTVVGAGGIAAIAANATYGARHRRPPLAWLVTGYVTAILNLGAWAACLAVLGPGEPLAWVLGGPLLAIGGADLGVTVWAHTRPVPAPPRFSLVPLAPLAGSGRAVGAFGGLGVRVSF